MSPPSACSASCPYGEFDWVNIWAVSGWTTSGDPDYDYALIELGSAPGYGWMSIGFDVTMDTTWSFNVRGYQNQDKPNYQMWSAYSPGLSTVNTLNFQ